MPSARPDGGPDDVTADPGVRALEPVTERILRALPGRRIVWILIWSALPLASPFVYSATIQLTGRSFGPAEFFHAFWTQGSLAWACLVLLLGNGRLGAEARATRQELVQAAPDHVPRRLFDAIARVWPGLFMTALIGVITVANNAVAYGPLPALAGVPVFLVHMFPVMTFIWVYVAILADINRLGEIPLVLDRFPEDRTMGLSHVGSLASTGLGLLLVAAAPVLLLGSDQPVTLAISLTLVLGAVGVYGLSMWRLHHQMAAAKERHVATARRLYADAYAAIRARPDVETLEASSSALSVAQSLDARAAGLPTWPIDEGTARFVAVIITGVLTSIIVRALFAAIGF